ncbi:MAG: acyl-ACP desaturase [Vicinamibacterales bacterium]
MTRRLSDVDLLRALAPTVASGLARHLAAAREWLPHEVVPWSRGRDFSGDGGMAWSPDQSTLSPAVRAAFELNLLTEDNLPSYHHALAARLGLDGAWGAWVHRWTAEEARHAAAIRDYLVVSRAVDPVALERDRMATLQAGWSDATTNVLRSLVYVSLQELATRIAHANTGRLAGDPAADLLLARIAADENLHMIFYRDLVAAALDLAPDQTLEALADEVEGFTMPGASVPGFRRRSVLVAEAGIYDARQHRDDVIAPLLRHWRALTRPAASDAGRRAQDRLAARLQALDEMARRFESRRAARQGPLSGGRP